jgi:hypothetical protein
LAEIAPIKNTGVRPNSCFLLPVYGKLTPEQVYSSSTPVKGIKRRAPSVAASKSISSNTVSAAGGNEARAESGLNSYFITMGFSFSVNSDRPAMSGKITFGDINFFCQTILGLLTKRSNFYDNV